MITPSSRQEMQCAPGRSEARVLKWGLKFRIYIYIYIYIVRETERERVCVCVCECVTEIEREREREEEEEEETFGCRGQQMKKRAPSFCS